MMTGWIKVTDEYGPVYINVDRINYVTECQGGIRHSLGETEIDIADKTLCVKEPINEVLKAIKLARPTKI